MEQTRNRKKARSDGTGSAWKRNVMAMSVAAALACVGMPAYAQMVACNDKQAGDATGPDSTACGAQAEATADGSVAVGYQAKAFAKSSLALGRAAVVDSGAEGSVALGAGSHATGDLSKAAYLGAPTDLKPTAELAIGTIEAGRPLVLRRITGLAPGANDYDAVNVLQLKKANLDNARAVKYDWTDANGNGAADADEINYRKITLDPAGTTITNVAAGSVTGTSTDAVNGSQLYAIDKTANAGWNLSVEGGATTNVAPRGTVDLKNDDENLVITKTAAGVTFDLADDITANKMTMGGTVVSTTGLAITGGPSVTASGIDMGNKTITNVAAGSISDTSTDAVNGSQLYAVDKTANAGWNLSVEGGAATNVAPRGSVDLSNIDENLVITKTAAGVTFDLADDITANKVTLGGTVVSTTGLAITGGPSITVSGIDAGGQKITNVVDGEANGDAVNKGQLDALAASAGLGWNLQANGGTADNIAGGQTVNVADGSNAAVTYDSATNTLNVGVADAPTFVGMVTANGGLTVGAGTKVDMGENVVTNVGAGTIDAASMNAVNGSQLFGIGQSVANALGGDAVVAADGTVTSPQFDLTNANTIAGTTGAAANVGDGFEKVDQALGALNTSIGDITNGNAGIRYFHVSSDAADSVATGSHAIAVGPEAIANQGEAIAMGHGAQAINGATTAVGSGAWAYGYQSTAVGFYADTRGDYSSAFGSALAFGRGTTALGAWAYAGGGFDWTGDGGARPGNIVEIVNGTAVGFSSVAAADNATAVGAEAEALGTGSVALGSTANVSAPDAVAIGSGASASVDNSVALGSASATSAVVGTASTTINGQTYEFAGAAPVGTVSVGDVGAERTITNVAAGRLDENSTDAVNGSQLFATNQAVESITTIAGNANDLAVKYGWNDANGDGIATSDEIDYGTVRLEGTNGTVVDNVAPGFLDPGSMQAINGSQLFQSMTQVAAMLGGGATMTSQGLLAPSYFIQNNTYNDVGSALQALDIAVTRIDGRPVVGGSNLVGYTHSVEGGTTPYGDGGSSSTALGVNAHATGVEEAVAVGESATVGAEYGTAVGQGASVTAEGAVALGHNSVADRADTVSVGSAGAERQVVNVADATQGTDAINKRQLDRGVASANSYTDARVNALTDSFDLFQGAVDDRFRKQDRRIDRQGAMNAAMMNMAMSAAGIHTENRIGVGIGFEGGQTAMSLGYQRALSDRATITFGGAFSSDDSSVGLGAGFGW